jgi:hypothetical protein
MEPISNKAAQLEKWTVRKPHAPMHMLQPTTYARANWCIISHWMAKMKK